MTSPAPVTPTVSVVMPLYNKARDVARAIRSVLAQTVEDFELIVVDDGSTDNGYAAVETFADPRVRLHRQVNSGVSAARNTGVDVARANLICFIDADDAYRPDFLQNILALRERYPQAGAYAMNYEVVSTGGIGAPCVTSVDEPTVLLDPAAFFCIGRAGIPVHSSSVAVHREVFDEAGRFPIGVRLGEDIDTWLRLCFLKPIAFDRRIGGIYYLNAGERALDTHPPIERYVFFDTIDRWVAQQPELPIAVVDDAREFKNFFTIFYARFQVRWGQPREGRRALKSVRTRVFARLRWKWLLASYVPQSLQNWISGVMQGIR